MERPLEKIRSIEHSIDQMKVKLNLINKERSRETYKLDQLVNRSIPKIKVKIKDARFEEKVEHFL